MRTGRTLMTILLLGVAALGALAGCPRARARYPELAGQAGLVTVDLAGIGAASGRFHSYRTSNGTIVNLFVYREGSGEPHAVLDACRTCYRWKKGYALDGQEVVCLKCDMRFQLEGLAHGTGSCVPIALASEQRGETLVIPIADLEAAARYF